MLFFNFSNFFIGKSKHVLNAINQRRNVATMVMMEDAGGAAKGTKCASNLFLLRVAGMI